MHHCPPDLFLDKEHHFIAAHVIKRLVWCTGSSALHGRVAIWVRCVELLNLLQYSGLWWKPSLHIRLICLAKLLEHFVPPRITNRPDRVDGEHVTLLDSIEPARLTKGLGGHAIKRLRGHVTAGEGGHVTS